MTRYQLSLAVAITSLVVMLVPQFARSAASTDPIVAQWGAPRVTIGQTVDLKVTSSILAAGTQIYFYVGSDAANTTTVNLNGVSVILPVDHADLVGSASLTSGAAEVPYRVVKDPALCGVQRTLVAVAIVNGIAVVSKLALSGPILGDDIS